MNRRKILIAIIILGLFLRTAKISTLPLGFTPDEANHGYTAYSILKTGKDEWGVRFPIAPRSFGEYKSPLYTYLTIIPVAIFGLNEFSTRITNALAGSLAVLVTYFLVKELFSRKKLLNLKTETLAMVSSFMVAINPWHISLSRGAFEPNLPTLFIPLGLLLFLKGLRSDKFMTLAVISFGLAMFSYYSARFFVPIFVVLLLIIFRKKISIKLVGYKKSIATLITTLFLLFISIYTGGNTRSIDVAIFNPTHGWEMVSTLRFEATRLGLPDFVSRIFNNKVVYVIDTFTSNYISHFSPQFLFTEGASEATHGLIPGRGLLYPVELLFLFVFTIYLSKSGKLYSNTKILLFWILLAPVPSSLAKSGGFVPTRSVILIPAICILSAAGSLLVIKFLSKYISSKYATRFILLVLISSLTIFLESYIYHGPYVTSRKMNYGQRQLSEILKQKSDKYDKIIISRTFSEAQMFLSFYLQLDPAVVQEESKDWLRYQKEGLQFVDQMGEYALGKYTIRRISFSEDKNLENTMLVGEPGDFPTNMIPKNTIKYPNQKDDAIVIIDPQNPRDYELP